MYPNSGLFVRILDTIDRIICKACPFLAGGILVGSVYWTAVTYGAVTIMQVLGHKEGLNVMEKADPLIMLIGLPAIPVMLMLGRLIRWEEAVLKFWRKHSTKLPILNLLFPSSSASNSEYLPRMPSVNYSSNSDPVSFTRTICGGLVLPTISTIFGKLLFQRINSNFQRSIIGGIAFIGLKGIFKIYYKHQQFLRQAHRQIKNYSETNSPSSSSSSSTQTVNYSSSLHAQQGSNDNRRVNRRYRQSLSESQPQQSSTSASSFHSSLLVNQGATTSSSLQASSESSSKSHNSSFNDDDLNESEFNSTTASNTDSLEHKSSLDYNSSNFSTREY